MQTQNLPSAVPFVVDTDPTKPESQRSPTVPPSSNAYQAHHNLAAIHSSTRNNYTGHSQDVPPVVNSSAPSQILSTVPRNNGPESSTLESSLSGFPTRHASLNLTAPRRLQSSIVDLSAQYGIPSILPPAPSTAPRTSNPPPQPQSTTFFPDQDTLVANYLKMLSQPADSPMLSENTMTAEPANSQTAVAPTGSASGPSETEMSRYVEDMLASPHFQTTHDDFLTSPLLNTPFDTPYDDFDTSPMGDSPFADFLNTPVIGLEDTFDIFEINSPSMDNNPMQLFTPLDGYPPSSKAPDSAFSTHPPSFDNLYTISPGTPALDSFHLPAVPPPSASPSMMDTSLGTGRRKSSGATGTRKNITPDSLLSLDAPTQPRTYRIPSQTSRKEVPAGFAKKRSRSVAFGAEDDEDKLEELSPNATEKEQIEWKRRQNTIAARKSRKRKLEYTQNLEAENEHLRRTVEKLQTEKDMLRQLLGMQGVDIPAEL